MALVGPDSRLWQTAPELALVLLATFPSGLPSVVSAREDLSCLLDSAPNSWPQLSSLATVVVHARALLAPLPHSAVFVGIPFGDSGLQWSQWSNPYAALGSAAPGDEFRLYIESRCDLDYYLRPLLGKQLVCNCDLPQSQCHAFHLVRCVRSLFSEPASVTLSCEDSDTTSEESRIESDCEGDSVVRFRERGVEALRKCETLRGSRLSRWSSWQTSWRRLVDEVRTFVCQCFWELFSGTGVLSAAFMDAGWQVAPPIDVVIDPAFNLLDPLFVAVILGVLSEGRVALLHLAPPCSTWSRAVNRFLSHRLRSSEFPGGLPNLDSAKQEKVRLGNELAQVALDLAKQQHASGNDMGGFWQLEQPSGSIMLLWEPWAAFVRGVGACRADRDVCVDGAPWRKPTAIIANSSVVSTLRASCPGCATHVELAGKAPDGRQWTAIVSPYWPAFCDRWVAVWGFCRELPIVAHPTCNLSELMMPHQDVTRMLENANFSPSGRRSKFTVGVRVSAASQPARQALPTMIPDGLSPASHLHVALKIPHPFTRPPSLFGPVEQAIWSQEQDPELVNQRRTCIQAALVRLADSLIQERDFVLTQVHPSVRTVLVANKHIKNVPFLREVSFICHARDWALWSEFVLGLPMIGWARRAPTMQPREVFPTSSVENFLDSSMARNAKLLARIGPSGDQALDIGAWQKTMDEVAWGVVEGPFFSVEDLPFGQVCIVPRHGIWEQHGVAEAPNHPCY